MESVEEVKLCKATTKELRFEQNGLKIIISQVNLRCVTEVALVLE